jgi:hypothetical protein
VSMPSWRPVGHWNHKRDLCAIEHAWNDSNPGNPNRSIDVRAHGPGAVPEPRTVGAMTVWSARKDGGEMMAKFRLKRQDVKPLDVSRGDFAPRVDAWIVWPRGNMPTSQLPAICGSAHGQRFR